MILLRVGHHEVLVTYTGRRRAAVPSRFPTDRARTRTLRRVDLASETPTDAPEVLAFGAPRPLPKVVSGAVEHTAL